MTDTIPVSSIKKAQILRNWCEQSKCPHNLDNDEPKEPYSSGKKFNAQHNNESGNKTVFCTYNSQTLLNEANNKRIEYVQ